MQGRHPPFRSRRVPAALGLVLLLLAAPGCGGAPDGPEPAPPG
ncbi:hypothetical protein [Streptomyces sp. LN699]